MPAKTRRGWTSVQTRLTGIVVAAAVVAVLALALSQLGETRRIDAYLAADAIAHGELLDRALELEGSSLATFAYDYTYWDEMVRFVQTGDRTWASQNIDEALHTYRANAAWVFDAAGAPVYATRDSVLETDPEPLPSGLSVKDVFGHDHFCHFFITGPDGPIEIRGATVHPSDDPERRTPVRGYLLVARLWNGQHLAELSRLTGKNMRIESARAGATPSAVIARQSGKITFTRPLPGVQGKAELMLTASLMPDWIAVARRTGRGLFLQMSLLVLLGVVGLTLVLQLWVAQPLGLLGRSLESGSTEALRPLERNRTEFGQLAQLVGRFFGQNATLVKEATERKQAEGVARRAAQDWQATFDGINDAVCILSPEGTIRQCNAAMARLVRSSPEALVGRPCHEVVHGTFEPPTDCPLVRARASRGRERFDAAVGDRFVEVTVDPLLDETGRMTGAVHVIVDVTERKQAEQTLRESEERFRELFESMSSGVAVYETRDQGASFIFTKLNRGAERIDSLRREEVVGRSVQQVFPGIEKFGLLAVLRRVWQTGKAERHPVGHYEDDRIAGWRESYVYKLPSGEVVAVYDDVTARVQAEVALRESERRHRETIDALPETVFEFGPGGRLTLVNRSGLAAFGLAEADIARGVNALQLLVPEDRERAAADIRRVMGGESQLSTDYTALRKDGSRFPAIIHADRIMRDGQPAGLRGTLMDISVRKQAEAALRESEERFRGIFDAARDGMALADVETGRVVAANGAFCNMVGYGPEEIVRLSVSDFYPSESLAYVKEAFDKQAAGKTSLSPELPMKRRDGSVFYVDVNSAAVSLGGRNLLIGVFRDITERRAAEGKLRESELKFRAIFDTASDGMILVDPDSRRFLLANSSCLRMLGYSADEFANLRITDLHPEEDLPFIFGQIGAFVKGETGRRGDTRFKRKDGSLFPADTNPAGMMLGDKKCILIVFRDITERKRAEEALLAKEHEIQRSNAELEQFAYIASHDLQEPLRMVSSYTQLLARRYEGKLDKEADEFIRFAVDGASRMQLLINDLLTYSRVGRRGKEPQPTDSGVVLERALQNLKLAIEDNRGSVTYDPLPVVRADDRQLEQLFQNLVGNAIKYHGDEPPRVHISAERSNGWWTFAIKDNGIGIEPQYHERIFQVFQRLHTRKEYSGTGIGLAVCTRIVERHGGRIWVESEPGKGSIFMFTLPAKGA